MSDLYQSLSHSKWDCKYHVVFVPKRRRRVLFVQVRRHLGEIFHALARQKECQIVEGHLMPDHVHMCIAIPPKYRVASVVGFLKGKSAIAVARLCGKERNFTGEHLWPGATRYPPLGSSWSKFAATSATKRKRMEQADSEHSQLRRALARRQDQLGNCLRGSPTHQATRSAGGV
jgi:putative transposase